MTYTRKAIRGTLITFIGIFLAAFLTYITRIILARSLKPADYGLFFAVFIFISYFEMFRDFGLNAALVKYIAEFKVKKREDLIKSSLASAFIIQLVSAMVLVIFLFLISDFLAINYFKDLRAGLLIKILSLFLVFNVFDDIQRKIVHGHHKMHMLALLEFGRNSFILILSILFLSMGLSVLAPTYAYIFSPILTALIFIPIIIRSFNFFNAKWAITKKLIKKMFLFGIPSIFATFADKIIAFADILILTFFVGLTTNVSMEKVGIYNVVIPTALLLLYFARGIALVMMPLSSELWVKKEKEKLSDGLGRLHKYSLIIVIPVALVMISFSKLYLEFFFGKEYSPGALALQIILIGTIFFTLAKINNTVIQNIGKPKIVAKIIGFAALLNILLNFLLIPIYGIVGAAIATTITYIFAWIVSNYQIKRIVKTNIQWTNLIKLFISGIIFVVIVFLIKRLLTINVYLEFIVILIVASLIYTYLIVWPLRIISIQEIKNLIKIAKN